MILLTALTLALVSAGSPRGAEAGLALRSDGSVMQPPSQDSSSDEALISPPETVPTIVKSPLSEHVLALILQYAMHDQTAKRLSDPGLKALYLKYQRGFDDSPTIRVSGAGAVEANGLYYRQEPGSTPPKSWMMDYTCPVYAKKKWVQATKGRRWYEKSPEGPYIAYQWNWWSCSGGLKPNGRRYFNGRAYYNNGPETVTDWERNFLGLQDERRSANTDIPSEIGWKTYPNGPWSEFPVPKIEVLYS